MQTYLFRDQRRREVSLSAHVTKHHTHTGLALGSALKEIQTGNPGFEKNISERAKHAHAYLYTRTKCTHMHTPHPHATQQAHTTYLHAHACKHARQRVHSQQAHAHTCPLVRALATPRPCACMPRHTCTSGLKTGSSSRPRTLSCAQWAVNAAMRWVAP